MNTSKDEVNNLWKELLKIINKNWVKNETTLIQFYYAGHAVMFTKTEILYNTSNLNKVRGFIFEEKIRGLSERKGAFVTACFDGCREDFNKVDNQQKVIEARKVAVGILTRG